MELSKAKLEIYEKNLQCLQEATDELMRRMKGYDYSFRPEITDKKGEFCPEKLHGLVEEMLSLWEEKVRKGTFHGVGERWVKPYIQARRELYGLYIYLVMRCSLYRGGYFYTWGYEQEERTDFAFLLEQAKWFSRSWCITDGPKGSRQNEPNDGYDRHFGFHFYSPINHYLTFQDLDVRNLEDDWAMTPPHMRAENRGYDWAGVPEEEDESEGADEPQETDEPKADETEKADEPQETEQPEEADGPDMDGEELYDEEDDDDGSAYAYDPYDWEEDEFVSPLDMMDEEERAAWQEAEWEYQGKMDERNWELLQIVLRFEHTDEYFSACHRFEELFKKAKTEVLRDFCRELEEIVNLYLSQREIAPLADTEKALDVYGRVCEGPLRQARIYGRGLQWKDL